ncbi:MAG: HAMP domain-containing sensor histidine kinase [Opitutaceae bacterium]
MPAASPARPSPLSRRRRLRVRLAIGWSAFLLATLAASLAVHRLYETVRRELEEQSDVALTQRQTEFLERTKTLTDALRQSTIKKLASFHVDGLTHALREWDEASAVIVGTFQWEESSGFLPTSALLAAKSAPDDFAPLWRQFRAWRETHPAATASEPATIGAYRTTAVRTLDNPLFPASELGYQSENLDIFSFAGRRADPWAGWASRRDDPTTPWIFWYQVGAGAPVRGALVDASALLAQLRGELADRRLAHIELQSSTGLSSTAILPVGLENHLPGFSLVARPGDLFLQKQSDARLSALAAGSLLGVFLLGAAFLALYSRREVRDAERKTNFVTQVSHELRTPLTSIRMFADMLAAPDLPEEKRARFAGTIGRESERLSGLIERLLTFNSLEKDARPVATSPIDVAAVVRETLEEMEATLHAAGMHAEPELPAEPVIATTDRSSLKQALLNLLENALKYARDGKTIRVTLTPAPDLVRLRVADEGPGIAGSLGERAFEPFVQGGQALTDKPSGVGLGLSIARGLLRRAGGDLVLLPSARGALFEIRLPLASPA